MNDDQAINILANRLEREPEDIQAMESLALLYLKAGNMTDAKEIATQLAVRIPTNEVARSIFEELFREGGELGAFTGFAEDRKSIITEAFEKAMVEGNDEEIADGS